MADADKLNLIQSSENTGWYRSVRPTLGAKDMRTEKDIVVFGSDAGYSRVPAGRFARFTQPFETISAPLA